MDRNFKLPLIAKGDVDGFFGLMVDNLVQILIIIFLCQNFCGMTGKYYGQRNFHHGGRLYLDLNDSCRHLRLSY